MSKSVFSYPGAKALLSSWIIDHFPQHNCYVEAFGGSGAILANKHRSSTEVFNDLDGDIVQFFRVLRNDGDELREWLENVPFARDVHESWVSDYYDGYRPDDPIERAGRFFTLRYTQFAQKYSGPSGFRGATRSNPARQFTNATEELEEFTNRLKHVQIENLDYGDLVDRYDSPETFSYFDPPYMDEGDDLYSHEGGFDHGRFCDTLEQMDGRWMVSYTRLPEPLQSDSYYVVEKDKRVSMRAGQDDGEWSKDATERLVMNYDPAEIPMFREENQTGLGAFNPDN